MTEVPVYVRRSRRRSRLCPASRKVSNAFAAQCVACAPCSWARCDTALPKGIRLNGTVRKIVTGADRQTGDGAHRLSVQVLGPGRSAMPCGRCHGACCRPVAGPTQRPSHQHFDDARQAHAPLPIGWARRRDGKAISIKEPGRPEVLERTAAEDPSPAAGEVIVDVVASAVNRADVAQRMGWYPVPPGASPYPGLEVSGRISAIGEGVPQRQPFRCASSTRNAHRAADPANLAPPGPHPCHDRHSAAYAPCAATSSSWLPSSLMRPFSTTAITSAS